MRPAPRMLALLVLVGVMPALLAAEPSSPDAREWVQRMIQAVDRENYTGTFVYAHGGQMEAMRIVHRGDGAERLLSLTGAAREIVRTDDGITGILPPRTASGRITRTYIQNPVDELIPGDVGNLEAMYSLELTGNDRAAERAAQRVRIRPHDEFRYGYEFWIDIATGLPLRIALADPDGTPVKRVLFVELSVHEHIPDAWLKPTLTGKRVSWALDRTRVRADPDASSDWRVADLPRGFRLTLHERRRLPGSAEQPVEHRLYSDGLASVSVYVEQERDDVRGISFTGGSRVGAVSAYGRVVDGYQTVVVGEVPLATVRRIGRSIEHDTGARQ